MAQPALRGEVRSRPPRDTQLGGGTSSWIEPAGGAGQALSSRQPPVSPGPTFAPTPGVPVSMWGTPLRSVRTVARRSGPCETQHKAATVVLPSRAPHAPFFSAGSMQWPSRAPARALKFHENARPELGIAEGGCKSARDAKGGLILSRRPLLGDPRWTADRLRALQAGVAPSHSGRPPKGSTAFGLPAEYWPSDLEAVRLRQGAVASRFVRNRTPSR